MNVQDIEFVYYITPDGTQYPLFGGRRHMMRWRGLGMPDLRYISDKGPFQHGETVRDYRLQTRILDLDVYYRGHCRDDYWNDFGLLSDTLRPNRSATNLPGRLLVITSTGVEREIFARILDGPSNDYQADDETLPTDQSQRLRFMCENPVWRDPNQQELAFTIVIDANLIFYEAVNWPNKAIFPITFGTAIINASADITYTGTWLAYPVILIQGPISRPRIVNLTTNEEIALEYDVSSGELVTIDLDTDNRQIKTVTNNFGMNLIGTVTNPNSLATFHLEVAPIAAGGVNTIQVSGGNGVAGESAISIRYYRQYLAVPL